MNPPNRKLIAGELWRSSEVVKFCQLKVVNVRRWEDEEYRHVEIRVPGRLIEWAHESLRRSWVVLRTCFNLMCDCSTRAGCNCKPLEFKIINSDAENSKLGN